MNARLLLVPKEMKSFLVKNLETDFHCQFGRVTKELLQQTEPGTTITTNTGTEMILLDPSFDDFLKKIKRGAQIIPRKDIGSIISHTGLTRDSQVLDVGAGSGGLTLHLAKIAKKVYTCDIREDHLDIVRKNAEMLGLTNIIFKQLDVYDPTQVTSIKTTFDIITLDLPEPWRALESVKRLLQPGGIVSSYSPNITQTMALCNAVSEGSDFIQLHTIEATETEWTIRDRRVRPKTQSIDHSGFLTFLRKVSRP